MINKIEKHFTLMIKNLPPMREIQVQSQSQADSLEKEMATHSSILAWEIPWTVEPGGLQSMEPQKVGYDFVIKQQQQQKYKLPHSYNPYIQ